MLSTASSQSNFSTARTSTACICLWHKRLTICHVKMEVRLGRHRLFLGGARLPASMMQKTMALDQQANQPSDYLFLETNQPLCSRGLSVTAAATVGTITA